MMTCHHGTCLCATLLLGFISHAAASECLASSGRCQELGEEAPASVELVQFYLELANATQKEVAAVSGGNTTQKEVAAVKGGNTTQKEVALVRGGEQWPNIGNLIPGVTDALADVAARALLTALNTSLDAITNQADSLLDLCNGFRTDIISSINATISQGLEDGIATLQTVVNEKLVPISDAWNSIVSLFQTIGQIVISGLNGIQFTVTAATVERYYNRLMDAAQWISGLFANSTALVHELPNTTQTEKKRVLQNLDAALDEGMDMATNLTDSLAEMMNSLLESLGNSTGVGPSLPPIQKKVDDLAARVRDALGTVINGTHEAANLAVHGTKSAAAALRVWLGLALTAACAGMSPSLRSN